MSLNKSYLILSVLLFLIEVIIALFIRDQIIRPYGGDYLVVILIYCIIKTFSDSPPYSTAVGVLLFSYLVEALQYFKLIYILGWEKSPAARILIGSSFAWLDIVAYTLGILTVILIERVVNKEATEFKTTISDRYEILCR